MLSCEELKQLAPHSLMSKLATNDQLKDMHPNLAKLATIGLVLPMSTADCERAGFQLYPGLKLMPAKAEKATERKAQSKQKARTSTRASRPATPTENLPQVPVPGYHAGVPSQQPTTRLQLRPAHAVGPCMVRGDGTSQACLHQVGTRCRDMVS